MRLKVQSVRLVVLAPLYVKDRRLIYSYIGLGKHIYIRSTKELPTGKKLPVEVTNSRRQVRKSLVQVV